MYVVANRVRVASGWEQTCEDRFRQRAGQVDMQPGFVRMQILRPVDDQSPYVLLSTWEDAAAFNHWVGGEDFKLAHRNPLPQEDFSGAGGLERHEMVIGTEVVA